VRSFSGSRDGQSWKGGFRSGTHRVCWKDARGSLSAWP